MVLDFVRWAVREFVGVPILYATTTTISSVLLHYTTTIVALDEVMQHVLRVEMGVPIWHTN